MHPELDLMKRNMDFCKYYIMEILFRFDRV